MSQLLFRFDRKTRETGSLPFDYKLIRSPRRRTIEVSVHPDQSIIVRAPRSMPERRILAFLQKKQHWIQTKRDAFRKKGPPGAPPVFRDGMTHFYLGEEYRLALFKGYPKSVRRIGRTISLHTPEPADERRIAAQMDAWYKAEAGAILPGMVDKAFVNFAPEFLQRRLRKAKPPTLTLRAMKRRWGSMSTRGEMVLNRDLIRAAPPLIHYVIVHELCHMVHANHSPAFYTLMDEALPDWRARKANLEAFYY